MIYDLIDSKLDVRLITRNVMSVYSTDKEYTDSFIRKLKHSDYVHNKSIVSSDKIIAYTRRFYNPYEFVYTYAKSSLDIDFAKLSSYLSFIGVDYLLWMKFYQIDYDAKRLLENLLLLASHKPIVILDYIDSYKFKNKLYTLAFHVGLEDRLIIIPFTNICDAVNNSTCQCYVKNDNAIKVQAEFSNSFLNTEFATSIEYYNRQRPAMYNNQSHALVPVKMNHSLYDILLLICYRIKLFFIYFYIWGTKLCL